MSASLHQEGAAAANGPSNAGAVFVWPTPLSTSQVQSLYRQEDTEDESPESQYRAMSTMLLADTSGSERSRILVDEMFVLLNWCEEQQFSPNQTALVLECALDILKKASKDPSGWITREASFEGFREDLLSKAVSEDGSLLMSVPLLERVTEHISQAFYVRWKALQFVFTQPEGVQDVHLAVSVDTPMPKPALASGEVLGELTITQAAAPEPSMESSESKTSGRASKGGKKSPRGKK